MLLSVVKSDFELKDFDKFLSNFADLDVLSERQINALKIVCSALKPQYRLIVLRSFESSCMFETKKLYFNILLEKLQDCILDIARIQADNATLESKDFISTYEARVLKIMYFLGQILDLQNEQIKEFVKEIMQKVAN